MSREAQTLCVAYIGLGASQGDRLATLNSAVDALLHSTQTSAVQLARSHVYATRPVGAAQEEFLNAAIALRVSMPASDLLDILHRVEREHGRTRDIHWGDRTLDLDLLLAFETVHQDGPTQLVELQTPNLTLPHPRIFERDFVLRPLADLCPELVVQGRSISQWLERVSATERTIRRIVATSRADAQIPWSSADPSMEANA